ncbi:MAG TPA: threonine synthase [Thermodesulfobacteriota bacterium]
MTAFSFMTHLECPRDGQRVDADRVQHLCGCGSPLLVRYDLEAVRRALPREALAGREPSPWRYHELLPVRDPKRVVTLGEGMTPLLPLPRLGAAIGLPKLVMKDEGVNPTGTFKARGAATGISRASELGVRAVAMPTNGNAGGAWAAYGARAGIEVVLCMPTDAPPMSVLESVAVGATAYMVRGQISDAGRMIAAAAAARGWYEAATLKEPYRIEGKKTMGYEIAEQIDWRLPDAILYPTGGGVGIIGIYKALLEMEALGWVRRPFPKLVAVQAAGCAPIVKAYEEGKDASVPWEGAETVAQGIRVPKALGDFLVLEAVRATGGTCIAVEDRDTMQGLRDVSRLEGTFVCPEGAALVPAARALLARGFLRPDDTVLLLNTGTGLKYPGILETKLPVLNVGDPLPA